MCAHMLTHVVRCEYMMYIDETLAEQCAHVSFDVTTQHTIVQHCCCMLQHYVTCSFHFTLCFNVFISCCFVLYTLHF